MQYNFKIYCYYHNPRLDSVSICRGYTFKEIFKEAYHICRKTYPILWDLFVVLDNKEIIFHFHVSQISIQVFYHRATNARAYGNFLKFFTWDFFSCEFFPVRYRIFLYTIIWEGEWKWKSQSRWKISMIFLKNHSIFGNYVLRIVNSTLRIIFLKL